MVLVVLESWDNVTSEVDDVIMAVRGNMAVVPCDVSWSSRPPAMIQFQRQPHPLTTTSTPLHLFSPTISLTIHVYSWVYLRGLASETLWR